jgi:hypothetical protein
MILTWNKTEMPPDADVLDCTKVAISFYGPEGYLGPIAWINLATGEYETRVRDQEGKPVELDGRFLYEPGRIDPHLVRCFLKAKDGTPIQEVSLSYVVELAALMKGQNVAQRFELEGSVP